MAVSNRSLALLALTTVGLASWWALRPAGGAATFRRRSHAEIVAASALQDSATRLGTLVRTAAMRNLVDSALQSYPAGQVPAIVVVGDVAPAAAMLTESLFTRLPPNPGTAHPMRLVVVESPTPSKWPLGAVLGFSILPDSAQAGACTVVTLVFPRDSTLDENSAKYWRRWPFFGAAGPCWFLARFGFPGSEVRTWLDERYWDAAGSIPPVDRTVAVLNEDLQDAGTLDRVFGNLVTRALHRSTTLAECAGQRPQLCERAFLRTPFAPGLTPAGIVGWGGSSGASLYSGGEWWVVGIGREDYSGLLAEMVDDLGPVRFTEFWTSDAPVAEAFKAAAGMSLGDWYRIQLRKQISAAGGPEPREATFWPSAFGILALALGGSLWLARRRQVR
jgi:hypothetical protein